MPHLSPSLAENISLCGAYRLVAAIFGKDPNKLLRQKGLLEPKRRCRGCGRDITGENQGIRFCEACRLIPVACEGCGEVILRRRQDVINAARRGQEHQFCGKRCFGAWVGTNYGFAVHPGNAGGKGGKRKYDYSFVWAEHLRTGYGCRRLSRLLSIPESSISHILRAQKKARDGGP